MTEALGKTSAHEAASDTKQVLIVKASGKQELFESVKLESSLMRAGASTETAHQVLARILPELKDGMTTLEIYRRAFGILRELSKPVARSYSLRRAIMDLGPSGFPFEDFIAKVLEAKSYTCLTRQTVLGGCVPHEVDVVAYNDEKLIMIEAKFHNELGIKSDLKVALYVKARFDDLMENVFNYGGSDRKVTDSWLITNTKFSSTAIHYGECKNMKLIGWNYPEQENLQDMIESESLHPITCLASLSSQEKKIVLDSGVVLCSSIKENPDILNELFGKNFDKKAVMDEINDL